MDKTGDPKAEQLALFPDWPVASSVSEVAQLVVPSNGDVAPSLPDTLDIEADDAAALVLENTLGVDALKGPPLFRCIDGTIPMAKRCEWDAERDGSPWDWPQRQVEVAFRSLHASQLVAAVQQAPRIVRDSGSGAAFRYLEFFTLISNAHTARAYRQAVDQFLAFCDPHARTLIEVAPYLVSAYLEQSTLSIPSRKQHLAALRRFFGHMVAQHVLPLNPATAIHGPKYSQTRGKTPALTAPEARLLLNSIETDSIIGLRDRALIGVMVYSFARVGAVVKLQVGDYFSVGKAWWLRLLEKGGKLHEVPAHHNAEKYLDEYIEGAGILGQHKAPLFRSLRGRAKGRDADQEGTRQRYLAAGGMDTNDVLRMIKRRAGAAGLSTRIGCHTFRATGITVFLQNGGTLEKAQQIAAHADPKTTKLYDRSNDALSLDEIERVLI